MIAYVQTTVAENLHPCRTTSRLLFKENRSTEAAVCSAVGDQRCSIGRRGLVEDRLPAGCTANSRSIVNERTVTGAWRVIVGARKYPKFRNTTLRTAGSGRIVDKSAIPSRRSFEEDCVTTAERKYATGSAAVVDKDAVARR